MKGPRLSALVLAAFCVFWAFAALAASRGILPVSCQLKLENDEIATGERMKVWAWYFMDQERRLPKPVCRIVVYALKGEILNGVQVAAEPDGIKAFQVGNGVVELEYKAPEECPGEPDEIRVYNSLDNRPVDDRPLDLTHRYEMIGQVQFKVLCPEGLTLTKTILHRTQSGNSLSLLEIAVTVRIGLKTMGGSAVALQDPAVSKYSGRVLYVSGDTREEYFLNSASVGSLSGAFQVFRDQGGDITSIGLAPISVVLSWRGDGGITPPAEIVVGPVRKPSDKEKKARVKALRQARKRAEGKPAMEIYGEVMPHLQKALTASPDLEASGISSRRQASGGGQIDRPEPDGIYRETFRWNLMMK